MSKIQMSSGGFTAVELLVILVMLATLFTTFTSSFNTIQTLNKRAKDINGANQLAFAKIQAYENTPFASLPSTSPSGTLVQVEDFSSTLPVTLTKPRSAIVYVNSVSSTLKQVVVNIQYDSGSSLHTIQYADFIQKNGL
jgi:type II secretory pathway pseudopilin PulG